MEYQINLIQQYGISRTQWITIAIICTFSLLAGVAAEATEPAKELAEYSELLLADDRSLAATDESPVTALCYSASAKQLVVGRTSRIDVFAMPKLELHCKLETELEQVHDLKFSRDGQFLLAVGGTPGEVGSVELWNPKNYQLIQSKTVAADVIYQADWHFDDKQACIVGADGNCRVLSIDGAIESPLSVDSAQVFSGHSKSVLSVQYLDLTTIASMGVDQTVRIWEPDGGRLVRVLDNHVGSVLAGVLQPAATHGQSSSLAVLATTSEDKTVRFWQPSVGRLLRFARLPSVAQAICWSSEGQLLYAACRDGQVRIIDPLKAKVERELAAELDRVYELVVIDSRTIAVAGEGGVKLLDIPKP